MSCFFCMSFQNSGQNTFVALNCPRRAVFFSLFRKVVLVVLEGNIPSLPFHLLCAFYAAAAAAIGGLIYKKYNHSFLYYV